MECRKTWERHATKMDIARVDISKDLTSSSLVWISRKTWLLHSLLNRRNHYDIMSALQVAPMPLYPKTTHHSNHTPLQPHTTPTTHHSNHTPLQPHTTLTAHHSNHCNQSRDIRLCPEICAGVATISSFLKIIGLFCKRALQKRLYSAKETYNFKEPTNRRNPIIEILTR